MKDSDRTDSNLIEHYLNGNETALEELINRHVDSVYNFTFRICKNEELAQDVTQEVFIKIWKNLKKYRPEKNFKIWLFSIAKNTTVDWLRKRKDLSFSDFDTDGGENFIENTIENKTPLPDEMAMLTEDKKMLLEKIFKLSPIHQTILNMRYHEDFSFLEISEILEKPINTVKSWHRRAIIELRKLL